MYDLTTVAYVLQTDFIKKSRKYLRRVKSVLCQKSAVDIDDIYDFKFVEMILQGGINVKRPRISSQALLGF